MPDPTPQPTISFDDFRSRWDVSSVGTGDPRIISSSFKIHTTKRYSIEDHPKFEDAARMLFQLYYLSLDQIFELHDLLSEIATEWAQQNRDLADCGRRVLTEDFEAVEAEVAKRPRVWLWKEKAKTVRIGKKWLKRHHLPLDAQNFTLGFFFFMSVKKFWTDSKTYTWDEFLECLREITCTEWEKHDVTGEYVGYVEGVYEANIKALFDMKYPHDFIICAVRHSCRSRHDSVPYVRLMCEYMKRLMDVTPPIDRRSEAQSESEGNE
jgi:hypothetical protein